MSLNFSYSSKASESARCSVYLSEIKGDYLFLKKEDIIPFVGPLIHQFWTSSDVSPRFQSLHFGASSHASNGFLRFISADLFVSSMVAESF